MPPCCVSVQVLLVRAAGFSRRNQTAAGVLRHIFAGRFLRAGADDRGLAGLARVRLDQHRLGLKFRILRHCGNELRFASRASHRQTRRHFFSEERC